MWNGSSLVERSRWKRAAFQNQSATRILEDRVKVLERSFVRPDSSRLRLPQVMPHGRPNEQRCQHQRRESETEPCLRVHLSMPKGEVEDQPGNADVEHDFLGSFAQFRGEDDKAQDEKSEGGRYQGRHACAVRLVIGRHGGFIGPGYTLRNLVIAAPRPKASIKKSQVRPMDTVTACLRRVCFASSSP